MNQQAFFFKLGIRQLQMNQIPSKAISRSNLFLYKLMKC